MWSIPLAVIEDLNLLTMLIAESGLDHTVLDALINADSPLKVLNMNGAYPLDMLARDLETWNKEGVGKAMIKLLSKGANPNTTKVSKNLPLMLAIENNLPIVVKSLLDAGADVLHVGEKQETPFD